MRLKDKVALVTGGSRGIGKAVVCSLAAEGARVYFTYHRSSDAAAEVARTCGATGVVCSQTDSQAVAATVERVLSEAGSLDILVNNAGITSDQYLMMMTLEDWEKVLDTNLTGSFRWTKAVSRHMMSRQQGTIVNIASVAGLVGTAGQTNYAASKGGLIAFTRALAAELGPKGIRVNAVVPGYIETDMTAKMPRQIKRETLGHIALKRFGKPEEVASVVVFLASGEAAYLLGQTVVVDGGLTGAAT